MAATDDDGDDDVEACALCVTSAPPSQFVMSVRSTIVVNVLTTIVGGMILFFNHITSDILCCSILVFWLCNVLCREGLRSNAVYFGDFPR